MNIFDKNQQPNLARELGLDPTLGPQEALTMRNILDGAISQIENAQVTPPAVKLPDYYVPEHLRQEPYRGQ
jgi:hypothetical protein